MWRAYAYPNDFERGVRLGLATQVSGPLDSYDVVTELNQRGATVVRVSPGGNEAATVPSDYLWIPTHEMGEAIYRALHRVYGNQADPAVIEALRVERARLDKILDKVIQ